MSGEHHNRESEILDFLRSVDAGAPQELHRRIEALVEERSGSRGSRRLAAAGLAGRAALGVRLGGALAVAAALAAVLVLVLSGGSGSYSPSLRETAALTLRPATTSAPGQSPRRPGELVAALDGVAFPYWEGSFGWRTTGARVDSLDGRAVRTVFYADERGQRIGYAILGGAPAPRLAGGTVRRLAGTPYRLLSENGSRVVAWIRDGHLCVVSGRGVDAATLLRLASWDERGAAA